jgi:hypothetical protein
MTTMRQYLPPVTPRLLALVTFYRMPLTVSLKAWRSMQNSADYLFTWLYYMLSKCSWPDGAVGYHVNRRPTGHGFRI